MLCFQLLIYFFSYTRSLKCVQLQELKNLSGVYVECYRFLIYVVIDSVYYTYQYSKTYTLYGGLNSVLLYESERR